YFINLPDLIILELFNYFTPINCVQLFFDIDERWNQLLHEKKYLTHLDYLSSQYLCPSTYTYFCRRVLPKIYHQIVSLSINENITCAKLKTFHFIKMKNLKYLKLSFIYQPEDLDQCLQQLEKNHIELGIQFMNRCKKEFFQILLKHIDNFEAFHCSDALNLKFNLPGGHRSFDYDLFDRIIRNLTNLKSLSFDLFTKERNMDGYRLQKTLSSMNLSYLEFRLVLCYCDYPCHRNPQITNKNIYLCSTFTQIQQWNICCHYDVLRQLYLIYTKPWMNNVAFGWIFEVLINTELKNDFYNVKYVSFCNSDKQHLTFNLLTKYFPNIIHLRLFQAFDSSPSLLSLRSTTEITKPLILNYCTTLITHDKYLTVQNNCLYECEKNLIPKRIRRLNLIVINQLYELTNFTLCRFLQFLECLWIEDNNDTSSLETMNIVQLVEQLFTQLPCLYNFKYIKEKKNIDFSTESFDKMLLFYSVELEDNCLTIWK
ncbi:unnamed protein product, partial [Didymodactylos carnosus]